MSPAPTPIALARRGVTIALLALAAACGGDSTAPPPEPGDDALIAFSFQPPAGIARIVVVASDGSDRRTVTTDASDAYAPSWHPDGRSLLFTSWRDELSRLYTVDLDAGGPGVYVPTGAFHAWEGSWSPDGSTIAVSTSNGVYLVEPGEEPQELETEQTASDAVWSPDGEWVAFTMLGESEQPGLRRRALFVVRPDGTGLRRLAASVHSPISDPAWSPDGERIVFEAYGVNSAGDLFTVGVASDDVDRLTETAEWERHPDWSPDGTRIAFVRGPVTSDHIFTMAADGSDVRQLTTEPGVHSTPRWRPPGS